jgi:hypothetical protein
MQAKTELVSLQSCLLQDIFLFIAWASYGIAVSLFLESGLLQIVARRELGLLRTGCLASGPYYGELAYTS